MRLDARWSSPGLSRRITIGGVGVSVLSLSRVQTGTVQEATPPGLATHAIVGAWRIIPDPSGPPPVLILYHADDTFLFSTPGRVPPQLMPPLRWPTRHRRMCGSALGNPVWPCRPASSTQTRLACSCVRSTSTVLSLDATG
jgi:hypothetical protein